MPAELKGRALYRDLIKEFKPNDGDLLACLHKVQHHFGYIPTDAVAAVAQQLKMTSAAVFGAITFYSEFRTTPPPALLVNWCSGPTCRLKGGDNIRKVMETTLGIGMEENVEDGSVGLHLQQCDGSCEYAPLVWLRRMDAHPEGPDAPLVAERGAIRGPISVSDAVTMSRRLKAGDLDV
jgi:NADH:ubiquinone oxidoreductase subunit E